MPGKLDYAALCRDFVNLGYEQTKNLKRFFEFRLSKEKKAYVYLVPTSSHKIDVRVHPWLDRKVLESLGGMKNNVEYRHHSNFIYPKTPYCKMPTGCSWQILFDTSEEMRRFLEAFAEKTPEELGFVSLTSLTAEDVEEIEKITKALESEVDESTLVTVQRAESNRRIGQGAFRKDVLAKEKLCRVTKVSDPDHLRAGHIKPWGDSEDTLEGSRERLDPENGLAFAPHIDHLFNDGWFTFENDGSVRVSSELCRDLMKAWGISEFDDPAANYGSFEPEQQKYLEWHRTKVFEKKLRRKSP